KKNQKCKLVSAKQNEINRPLDIIYQINEIIEGFLPPKTSLGPVPGSHGEIEGSSPTEMATVQAPPSPPSPPSPPFFSFLGGLSGDKQPKLPRIGEKEEQEKKQEYWEKELEKMDEKKKK
ncbi:unnamed protein product, partial [marine sediment metagenome]